jgi:hypothetical protein
MILERIDIKLNLANHLTKGLSRSLFHQHADFILGHIPPAYSPVYRSGGAHQKVPLKVVFLT